jgi:hypothetical protein
VKRVVLVGIMFCVLLGMGVAFVCLIVKRLFGQGYMWWEHGSRRCKIG